AMLFPLGRAVVARVIALTEWHAEPAGGKEQALDKSMATLARVLVLVVAPPLARAALPVAGAEGVLGLLTLLAGQRLIDQEQVGAGPLLQAQDLSAQDGGRCEPAQPLPPQ